MRWALVPLLALAACEQAPPAGSNTGSIGSERVDTEAPDGPLARYVGRFPDEPVRGRSFNREPLVRDAVARMVNDPAVAALVLSRGRRSPIVARDGQLVAAGCAPKDCAGRNWAILIRADGRAPQVCVKPAGGSPRWYGDAPVGAAKDSCPTGS